MLKFFNILTGKDYPQLDRIHQSTRQQIVLFGTCLLIPVLLWFFIGYLSSQNLFGAEWYTAIGIGLILAFLILLIERAILMSNKSLGIKTFRVVLGLCVALIGAVLLDEVVFHNDIQNRINEYRTEYIQDTEEQIKNDYQSRIPTAENAVQNAEKNWMVAQEKALKELQGYGATGRIGVGPIYERLKENSDRLEEIYLEARDNLTELQSGLQTAKIKASELARAEFNGDGILMKVRALMDLIRGDYIMMVVFLLFFIFIFCLEFIVVIIKMTSKENLDDKVAALLEEQKELELRNAINRVISQHGKRGILGDYTLPKELTPLGLHAA